MKEIKTIYAILTTENGEETICAVQLPGQAFQAISSKMNLLEAALPILKASGPGKEFRIVSFEREK